jgi:hypothetical protein
LPLIHDLFNIDNLDLLTQEEKQFNEEYVRKLNGYATGEIDGVQIRNLTAGAATIAKRQQSRSAVAVLKWSITQRTTDLRSTLIEDKNVNS